MVPKSTQVQLYLQQSIFAYLQNLVEIKYQQALHNVEIQLIQHLQTQSILQQGKVDIFSPTLINIWSEKLQIKIKSVYVKAQKSQLQLGSFQERLLKNRGAHTVPYLVKFCVLQYCRLSKIVLTPKLGQSTRSLNVFKIRLLTKSDERYWITHYFKTQNLICHYNQSGQTYYHFNYHLTQ
ncbi:Hypothetical_protein [Hexamita inflata]|uniref:Hypothetical_protein n=1 Tax=Hexamita inflata TaxID=28002 RepID=A0ABP1HYN4_9EUKA